MSDTERGVTLIEMLVVIAIAGLVTAIAVPQFLTLQRHAAVRAAASELQTAFHLARSRSITRGWNTGVKFAPSGGEWTYALYDDGDGDGVRNDDISRGVDRCVRLPRRVMNESRLATVSLPSFPIVDPDGETLEAGSSPVRFGRSTICSFSPLGHSTPGTLYISDRVGELYALRVSPVTARIRIMRYLGRSWRR